MARIKSPEKRSAILDAAVQEIAAAGLSAPTAKIAERAGIATGTLFTYFATKEELLNALYLELKLEIYGRVNAKFPRKASLGQRARHLWATSLNWAIEFPEKRKVSLQLSISSVITPETRKQANAASEAVGETLKELEQGGAVRDLPEGFVSAVLSAMQEATMDFIGRQPKRREELIERTFAVIWRALK
jgi:AcrR family transcriptional regulator